MEKRKANKSSTQVSMRKKSKVQKKSVHKKMRTKRAWAIVDKKNPQFNIYEIYADRDVVILASERFVRIEIKEVSE